MTNDNGEQGKATTVVYGVAGGDVTVNRSTQTQAAVPAAVPTDERVLSAADVPTDGSDVEYEPVVYSDPGQVTEQFDHLATRDVQEMAARMGSGDVEDHGEMPQTAAFSPEAAALAGGNELTTNAQGAAVTRLHSDDYDLAESETDPRP
ncbi:hypothetical protein [Deinococcus radiophilus]|uniref:Uncharacterized protein n=1 Tax=Deinococcus radiophilus TaxID=32062 RepID=A0A3S0KFI6_9DEIO|nr:hypothetical protein [Deinococcus radiophilus]RTR29396.1 hypothetical protein EJ104_03120 [Deinococcus radiophilus]UFA50776.1 hypothetical protein LMT64_02385 [Deinococcus radiophilus]